MTKCYATGKLRAVKPFTAQLSKGSRFCAAAQRRVQGKAPRRTCAAEEDKSASALEHKQISRRDLIAIAGATPALLPGGSEAAQPGWYEIPPANPPKTILITGANSGIGYAGAGKLLSAGHNILAVCRTQSKAEAACRQLQEQYGNGAGSVSPEVCELGSLSSVRQLAQRVLDTGVTLDVLCLNAGAQFVNAPEPQRTAEGFELTVGANHLAHFLLANLLLPALEKSSNGPRIIVTASEVHDPLSSGGKVGTGATLGDLSGLASGAGFSMVSGEAWDANKAYKDSKLCNVLFMRELSQRLAAAGSAVTVNAFGPGLITRTGFFRNADPVFIKPFDFITNNVLGVAATVQEGGDCLAFMAVDTSLDGRSGVWFNNDVSGIPLVSPGHTFHEIDPSIEAQNADEAKLLWDVSGRLVGLA